MQEIILFFFFFSAIIKLIRELVISNMHNNFGRLHEKLSMLSCPQGQIIDVKCEKSQVNYPKPAILNF